MQTFNSRPFTIKSDRTTLHGYIAHPATFAPFVEKYKEQMPGNVSINATEQGFALELPMIGELSFALSPESTPFLVKYSAVSSPLPLSIAIQLNDAAEAGNTEVVVGIEAELPPIVKGMVQGKIGDMLKKVADGLDGLDPSKFLTR